MTDYSKLKATHVKITVVKTPRTSDQKTTLLKLLGRDPAVIKGNRKLSKIRAGMVHQYVRAGGMWEHYPKKVHLVHGRVGETTTLPLTLDLRRTLPSLGESIKVEAVKTK